MKETPLDEKTEHEFTNILAKISQDNPDFFENMSREELETLEYLLSEKVRQSALLSIILVHETQGIVNHFSQIIDNLIERNEELENQIAGEKEHGVDYGNDDENEEYLLNHLDEMNTTSNQESERTRKTLNMMLFPERKFAGRKSRNLCELCIS